MQRFREASVHQKDNVRWNFIALLVLGSQAVQAFEEPNSDARPGKLQLQEESTCSAFLLQQSASAKTAVTSADTLKSSLRQVSGFYLTQNNSRHQVRQRRIEGLLAAEPGLAVHAYMPLDPPRFTHHQAVHQAHIEMIERCNKMRPSEPCLILEDDSDWQPGLLKDRIAKIIEEQGDTWDLAMLGMGVDNLKKLRRLRPSNRKPHSVRLQGTRGGCHAYLVNRGESLDKVLGLLRHRRGQACAIQATRHRVSTCTCVERISVEDSQEHNISIVAANPCFARQTGNSKKDGRYAWAVSEQLDVRYLHPSEHQNS
eukprot:TRINITY_DN6689_c0_g1_i2.p1 TRINITY_DN6689_c0_g1~~TRINITY_DN6689_c0_g1_i2.p1  ORF type:complete len:313 (+),score=50.93 TRINITY_DN6689_c0_g1_i2:107-1045(+)